MTTVNELTSQALKNLLSNQFTKNIGDLDDVDTTTTPPTEGQFLAYQSGLWKPKSNVFYNVKDYGAKCDGVTDDYTALSNLINNTISGADATVLFPFGTCIVGTNLTFPPNIKVVFEKGAILSVNAGITVTINGSIEAGFHRVFSGAGTITLSGANIPFVVPQWWGSKGDGVTVDTTAIQSALNSGAKNIFFPAGTYLIGSLAIPTTIQRFIGSGVNTTIFQGAGTLAAYDKFLTFSNGVGQEIAEFSMNVDSGIYNTNSCIFLLTTTYAHVHNIYIDQAGSIGVNLNGSSYNRISNVTVKNFAMRGIYVTGTTATQNVIENCVVIGTGIDHCIQCVDGSEHEVRGCHVENAAVFGINMWRTVRGLITGCSTLNTTKEGINIQGCSNTVITNNRIYFSATQSVDFGISLWGDTTANPVEYCQYNVVVNNTISRAGKSGIAVADNSSYNVIKGNTVVACNLMNESQGAGIILYGSGATKNLIQGNVIKDTGTTHKYGINEWNNGTTGSPNGNYFSNNFIDTFVTAAIGRLGATTTSTDNIPNALTAFTPTVTASTGTLTTVSATGKYIIEGKVCHVFYTITITTNGTGAGTILATLPRNGSSTGAGALSGRENAVSGKMLQGLVGTGNVNIANYDNTYPGANGAVLYLSGSYEIA